MRRTGITLSTLIAVLLSSLVAVAAADEAGEKPYERHCAACHGDDGHGGMGPALSGTALSADAFAAVVRSGKGMMPPMAADVSDAELGAIHRWLAEEEAGPGASGSIGAIAGALLSRENVSRIAWGSIAVMLAGFIIAVTKKYRTWSGAAFAKKYHRQLGARRIAAIFFRTLFVDLLSVSSVFKKSPGRWLIHGLILYGFCGLIAADILIAIVNPERTAMPFFSPLKILANLSGLSLAAGLTVVAYRMLTDPFEDNGETFFGDIAFVLLLTLTVLTGFAVEATRRLGFFEYTTAMYLGHIALISSLFVSAPLTRFSHIVSTFYLVLMTRLSEAAAADGVAVGFTEEPAPGRHYKTERMALDVKEKLCPDQPRATVAIRYYP